METPAMLWEMGNSSTLASLADPPGPNHPFECSRSYLKFSRGACLAPGRGAAMAGRGVVSEAAATPAPSKDAPARRLRRVISCEFFCWLMVLLRQRVWSARYSGHRIDSSCGAQTSSAQLKGSLIGKRSMRLNSGEYNARWTSVGLP